MYFFKKSDSYILRNRWTTDWVRDGHTARPLSKPAMSTYGIKLPKKYLRIYTCTYIQIYMFKWSGLYSSRRHVLIKTLMVICVHTYQKTSTNTNVKEHVDDQWEGNVRASPMYTFIFSSKIEISIIELKMLQCMLL